MKKVNEEIFENYCDEKTLQLLYDKGFRFYESINEDGKVENSLAEQRFNEGDVSYCENYITCSIAIEWIRENFGLYIIPRFKKIPEHSHTFYACDVIAIETGEKIESPLSIGHSYSPYIATMSTLKLVLSAIVK
jgi:hypothetical protein